MTRERSPESRERKRQTDRERRARLREDPEWLERERARRRARARERAQQSAEARVLQAVHRSQRWRRLRSSVLERDGYRCARCGTQLPARGLCVHHVEPLAKGGAPFEPTNLLTLCVPCHNGIRDRDPATAAVWDTAVVELLLDRQSAEHASDIERVELASARTVERAETAAAQAQKKAFEAIEDCAQAIDAMRTTKPKPVVHPEVAARLHATGLGYKRIAFLLGISRDDVRWLLGKK